jgi:hypothetical protein
MAKKPSSTAALKQLSRKNFEAGRAAEIFNEINSGPDRSVAIVLGALVEDGLRTAIMREMEQMRRVEEERLFGPLGPLSDFSSKILVGFGLKVIDAEMRSDLERIKGVRIAFAHGLFNLTFDLKEVKDVCNLISYRHKLFEPSPKLIFSFACAHLWVRLG